MLTDSVNMEHMKNANVCMTEKGICDFKEVLELSKFPHP